MRARAGRRRSTTAAAYQRVSTGQNTPGFRLKTASRSASVQLTHHHVLAGLRVPACKTDEAAPQQLLPHGCSHCACTAFLQPRERRTPIFLMRCSGGGATLIGASSSEPEQAAADVACSTAAAAAATAVGLVSRVSTMTVTPPSN